MTRQYPLHLALHGVDPVKEPPKPAGGGKDEGAAGGDEHRGGDHRGEDAGAGQGIEEFFFV